MKRFSWTTLAARLATAAVLFVAANVAQATPIALSTPGGLNAGDKFRFLFVTAGTTDATSTDINTYNSFVQAQAGGATYNGVTVNWKAIATTTTVDAILNVGGALSSTPVYLPSGTKIANDLTQSTGGLWAGPLFSFPNENIDGTSIGTVGTWTGSWTDGTMLTAGTAMGGATPVQGITNTVNNFGWLALSSAPAGALRNMYGVSEELTAAPSAVPEIDPAGMGSVLALVSGALGLLERRRRQTS